MQITDQQFIDAMHKAVEVGGCKNSAPGRYRDSTGAPSCVVGMALAQISMDLVPWNNKHLAKPLLMMRGCSFEVAEAAHYAQCANDMGLFWGDVIEVFDKSLSLLRRGLDKMVISAVIDPMIVNGRRKANEERERQHQAALKKTTEKIMKNFSVGGPIKNDGQMFYADSFVDAMNGLASSYTALGSAFTTLGQAITVSINTTASNTTVAHLAAMGIEPPHIKTEFSLTA